MRRRQGFTLVELLVALALIIFIMAILSQAFVAATKTFRDLKAAGDLAERLRMVTGRLHRELAANHLMNGSQPLRLSDGNFWLNGPPGGPNNSSVQGYFCIYQQQLPASNTTPAMDYFLEGTQANNNIPSTSTSTHGLAFTINLKQPGGYDEWKDFLSTTCALDTSAMTNLGTPDSRYQLIGAQYTTPAPGNVPMYMFNSQWGEVAIFMQPSGDVTALDPQNPTAPQQPLFNLYHRLRLVMTDNSQVPPVSSANNSQTLLFPEVSCEPDPTNPNNLYFNTPADLIVPQRRFGTPSSVMTPGTSGPAYPTLTSLGATGALANADLLLTDVLSFEVRMLFSDPSLPPGSTKPYLPQTAVTQPFMTLWDLQNSANPPPFTVGSSIPAGSNTLVFDTWTQHQDSAYGAAGNYSSPNWSTQGSTTQIPLWNSGTNNGPIILAIQITIRIWDRKSQLTRQVSLVQAM